MNYYQIINAGKMETPAKDPFNIVSYYVECIVYTT